MLKYNFTEKFTLIVKVVTPTPYHHSMKSHRHVSNGLCILNLNSTQKRSASSSDFFVPRKKNLQNLQVGWAVRVGMNVVAKGKFPAPTKNGAPACNPQTY
jgi:hypothetical protein